MSESLVLPARLTGPLQLVGGAAAVAAGAIGIGVAPVTFGTSAG
ncbi:MAG: hypothetical protein ACRCT8_16055 [Lacipirellulaceae bacterium]